MIMIYLKMAEFTTLSDSDGATVTAGFIQGPYTGACFNAQFFDTRVTDKNYMSVDPGH